MRGVGPGGDDERPTPVPSLYGGEACGLKEIGFLNDKVGAFEEGGNGTADEQRTKDAVELQAELERTGTDEVAFLMLELVADGLHNEGDEDEHPQPVGTAKAGAVEERESGKGGTAEGDKRGEREFPLATCGIDKHTTLVVGSTEREDERIAALNEHHENEQGSEKAD